MSYKDLEINESYESDVDDIVNDFYLPVLGETLYYDRIAGFFTSSSLAISAKGIYQIIKNKGRVRLLVSPRMNKNDLDVLKSLDVDLDKVLDIKFDEEILLDEQEIVKKHNQILGWLIKNDYLEMRVVLIKNNDSYLTADEINKKALFHQKVGIMTDLEGNKISFSGSINETLSAWNDNVEEFKTFKSWEPAQNKYCKSDEKKFNDFWEGTRSNVIVKSLPDSIKEKFIEMSPDDIDSVIKYIDKKQKKKNQKVSLFFYQEAAKRKWIDNNCKMLFEMATGTGKTRTAISCIEHIIQHKKAKIIIVATPQSTLSIQWKDEVEKLITPFDEIIIADGNNKWKNKLEGSILKIRIGQLSNLIIYTTHTTASSNEFLIRINEAIKCHVNVMFVGDEVHALGSKHQRKALLEDYKYRVGLSATPSRWFDDGGTILIENYFNNVKFEFTIRDALTTINPITNKPFLCKYMYYPKYTTLNEVEVEKYLELSQKIAKSSYMKNNDDENTFLDKLIRDRADIIKDAENKIHLVGDILTEIGIENISNTIIFVSHKLKYEVVKLLKRLKIPFQLFTQEQGTKSEKRYGGLSERQYIIKMFKQEHIKILIAIKCLDEGIDIPTADTAILVSSTTNPREYIQRVGRVIRQAPNKTRANIYDLIIAPDSSSEIDEKIKEKELNRIESIARNAQNNAEVLSSVFKEFNGGNYGY